MDKVKSRQLSESGYLLRKRHRLRERAMIFTSILAAFALAYTFQAYAGRNALADVRGKAQESLALQAETVSGILEKYRLMPPLLSRRDDIERLFDEPWHSDNRLHAHLQALRIAILSGAKQVIFADHTGRIFASSQSQQASGTIKDFAFFDIAMQGRLGRESLSSSQDDSSYVFASAVRDGKSIKGVIAVYVRFYRIEAAWSLSTMPIFVSGNSGRVFLSNREEWYQQSLYAGEDAIMEVVDRESGIYRLQDGKHVVQAVRELPLLDWRLHVLADYGPVAEVRWLAGLVAVLLAALGGIIGLFLIKRSQGNEIRQRQDKANALRLERQVHKRTRALSQTNETLAQEVEERKRAEEQLLRTQKELIQSTKLAALGQMSATLSHEYNQPLAAIRTYSDNALRFLSKGQDAAANEAVERIVGLTERMSELSRTLLGFARKPGTALNDVGVSAVIEESLLLVGPRARKEGISIDRSGVDAALFVRGGRVRLTQVVVNLANNAIDALTGIGVSGVTELPEIVISTIHEADDIVIVIEDNGPGVASGIKEQLFEPFFSTKEVGEGIGLGLSIVYQIVNELGGRIDVTESQKGGARFLIRLKQATIPAAEGMVEKRHG